MKKIDFIEKPEALRKGLFYRVLFREYKQYQIGAIINKMKPSSIENFHFIDKIFETREAALKRISEYMVPLMRDGEGWAIGQEVESFYFYFYIFGTSTHVPNEVLKLPFIFTTFGEAVKCIEGANRYFLNETRRQLFC